MDGGNLTPSDKMRNRDPEWREFSIAWWKQLSREERVRVKAKAWKVAIERGFNMSLATDPTCHTYAIMPLLYTDEELELMFVRWQIEKE